MYSLDVNFLKDRGLDNATETEGKVSQQPGSLAGYIPIGVGALVMIIFPLLSWSHARSFETKQVQTEAEIQKIDAEIAKIQGENRSLEEIQQQLDKAKIETQALVSVFDKIRPWSAIVKEVGDRTPPGVQVESLTQNGSGEGLQLRISGLARSYNDVNDFVLFLQRSSFFDPQKIVLGSANQTSLNVEVSNQEDLPDNISLTLPEVVKYSITAQLANKPTSELVEELERKGAVGVVTRLKTLEQQGAITK